MCVCACVCAFVFDLFGVVVVWYFLLVSFLLARFGLVCVCVCVCGGLVCYGVIIISFLRSFFSFVYVACVLDWLK